MRVKFAYRVSFTDPTTGEQSQGWTTQTIDSNEIPIYLEFTDEERQKIVGSLISQITKFDNLFLVPNGVDQSIISLFMPPKREEPKEPEPVVEEPVAAVEE